MMQELIDTLHTEQCTLVILHEGNIRTFNGHGVRRLYNLVSEEPELLYEAKIAIKAVGWSAAKMMVEGGVKEVWADYISQQACDALQSAGVVVKYGKCYDPASFLNVWQRLGELETEEASAPA